MGWTCNDVVRKLGALLILDPTVQYLLDSAEADTYICDQVSLVKG